jgi:hypothetical protein
VLLLLLLVCRSSTKNAVYVRTASESMPTQLLAFHFKLFDFVAVEVSHSCRTPFYSRRYSDFFEWTQALLEQQPGVQRQPLAPELALAVNEAKGARCGSVEYSTDHFRKVGVLNPPYSLIQSLKACQNTTSYRIHCTQCFHASL